MRWMIQTDRHKDCLDLRKPKSGYDVISKILSRARESPDDVAISSSPKIPRHPNAAIEILLLVTQRNDTGAVRKTQCNCRERKKSSGLV